MNLVLSQMVELNPDIIGLQECCREISNCTNCSDNFLDLHRALANAGLNYYTARVDTHLAWDMWQESVGIMSKFVC